MRVHQIYPTSIAEDRIVPSQDLLDHIDSLELATHGESNYRLHNVYGLRSKDTYIFDNPIFTEVRKQFEKKALWLMQEKMDMEVQDARMLQSWLSIKKQGQQHQRHRHSNCVVSGVWWFEYYEDFPPAPLTLHREKLSFQDSFAIKSKKKDWYYKPEAAGVYILFPAYTYHSVPMNINYMDRRSIAFNIGVGGSIGHEGSLNEMKFERLV